MQNQLALSGERIVEKNLPTTISSCWYDSWGILVERNKPKHPVTKLSAIYERLSRHYLSFVLK